MLTAALDFATILVNNRSKYRLAKNSIVQSNLSQKYQINENIVLFDRINIFAAHNKASCPPSNGHRLLNTIFAFTTTFHYYHTYLYQIYFVSHTMICSTRYLWLNAIVLLDYISFVHTDLIDQFFRQGKT
uniref:Uncharacterized protein n=1 Tax=Ditylenchus dipsaci TaxID=166011 RepID=A0A915D7M9_9BILA